MRSDAKGDDFPCHLPQIFSQRTPVTELSWKKRPGGGRSVLGRRLLQVRGGKTIVQSQVMVRIKVLL